MKLMSIQHNSYDDVSSVIMIEETSKCDVNIYHVWASLFLVANSLINGFVLVDTANPVKLNPI